MTRCLSVVPVSSHITLHRARMKKTLQPTSANQKRATNRRNQKPLLQNNQERTHWNTTETIYHFFVEKKPKRTTFGHPGASCTSKSTRVRASKNIPISTQQLLTGGSLFWTTATGIHERVVKLPKKAPLRTLSTHTGSKGLERGFATFRERTATVGRRFFSDFRCVRVGRESRVLLGWFLSAVLSHRQSSTGSVAVTATCATKNK